MHKHPLRFTSHRHYSSIPFGATVYRLPHNALVRIGDYFTFKDNPPKQGFLRVTSEDAHLLNKPTSASGLFIFYRTATN